MKKFVRVKNVEYIDGYKLRLAFTNGKIKIVDLSYIFKGNAGHYFEPLRDLERFKKSIAIMGRSVGPMKQISAQTFFISLVKISSVLRKSPKNILRSKSSQKDQDEGVLKY